MNVNLHLFFRVPLVGLLVCAALGACHESSSTSDPSGTDPVSTDTPRAHPSESPAVGAATGSIREQSALRFDSTRKRAIDRVGEFYVEAGEPVRWTLTLPASEHANARAPLTWADVNLQRFVARVPGGLQRSLAEGNRDTSEPIVTQFDRAGDTLVSTCIDTRRDLPRASGGDLTYCAKVILSVDGGDVMADAVDVTGKFADPIEVRPLVAPGYAKRGADLPVLCYVNNHKGANEPIEVHRPDGSRETVRTTAAGVANVRLNQVGAWMIRCDRRVGTQNYRAELFFDLPDNGVLR